MAGSLTNERIKDALPRERKYWLADELNNLYVLVMPNGAKYWKFRYRYDGRSDEVTVGKPYPRMLLPAARAEARRLQVLLDGGVDPQEKKRQEKRAAKQIRANTFEAAANDWYEFRTKAWKPRTAQQVRAYLDLDLLPALGRHPLDAITTSMLADLVHKIDDRGAPDVAKKARQWLKAIFQYARAKEWTTADPVRDLHAITIINAESEPHAHIPYEELPAFLAAMKEVSASPLVKGAAYLALWTASRPGVTRTLRWSEVDLDEGLWNIKKGRDEMKRGYRHVTPLSRQAVAALKDLHRISGTFEHVFVGRNDPSKPLSDGAVKAMFERMGYAGRQTMHGLRHVVSSALNRKGYVSDHIERQLAHKDPDKIRGVYNTEPYLEDRRTMLQDWADILDSLAGEPVAILS
ncbi:tyrosine-type recombinase/integrase [Dyella sedimenti]|uniref:tyrosine-type recombinase/integrase n=1 Tax=Dyella sedimenti TaxID=2919947 RepID=UPI001FAAEB82|nr:tyrosine-type recombinase/integrase [Dyella sedimenti]